MALSRRRFLTSGAGALVGAGLAGRYWLIPPAPSEELDTPPSLARRLFDALDPEARARACVDYDHPLRQYYNRGVDGGGSWVLGLERQARSLAVDLMYAGLSAQGRQRLPEQFFFQWPGVHSTRLLVCGNPHEPPYQVVLTGPHLNLRLGGASREGVAFGGPQVYGDQRGNDEVGLPGNVYRYQLVQGQELLAGLRPSERRAVRQQLAPVQTRVGLQGRAGRFDGVPVADLSRESRGRARELVAGILDTYAPEDVGYAWECLERNGGVDALRLADYDVDHQGGRRAGELPSQIFRLEGPAAVFYFRGVPHLHAFLHVAMDAERPLGVGETLATSSRVLETPELKALFENAMRSQTGADLAYYPSESVAGRLRAGPIRTGDIYALESWRDGVVVLEVKGAELREPLLAALRARGQAAGNRRYRVATSGHVASRLAAERVGRVESEEESGRMLRDVVIAHLKNSGLPLAS